MLYLFMNGTQLLYLHTRPKKNIITNIVFVFFIVCFHIICIHNNYKLNVQPKAHILMVNSLTF